MSVDFSGVNATIDYAGIEPGTPLTVGAGYQLNVTVPAGTASGMNYLDIGATGTLTVKLYRCYQLCLPPRTVARGWRAIHQP